MTTHPRLSPRTLFLLDGLGALLSALLLGLVLPAFPDFFGVSARVLYPLALIAAAFAVYSLTCYALNPAAWRGLLRLIAGLNLLYCALTAALIGWLHTAVTGYGVAYFLGEIAIVLALALTEWRTAARGGPAGGVLAGGPGTGSR